MSSGVLARAILHHRLMRIKNKEKARTLGLSVCCSSARPALRHKSFGRSFPSPRSGSHSGQCCKEQNLSDQPSINKVAVVDGTGDRAAGSVTVGSSPSGIAINTRTNRVYVANGGDATISVIDGATDAGLAKISAGMGFGSGHNIIALALRKRSVRARG